MPWVKGQSGNPKGRRKLIFSLKDAFEREVRRSGQAAAIQWLKEHHSDKYADLIVRYATEEIKRDMGTSSGLNALIDNRRFVFMLPDPDGLTPEQWEATRPKQVDAVDVRPVPSSHEAGPAVPRVLPSGQDSMPPDLRPLPGDRSLLDDE